MVVKKLVTLGQMQSGQTGKVIQVQGGRGLMGRLNALGIRPGQKISKTSSMFMRGPVTIKVGHTQMALGFGMANKILVELEGP